MFYIIQYEEAEARLKKAHLRSNVPSFDLKESKKDIGQNIKSSFNHY
jgi:hypothetical protein